MPLVTNERNYKGGMSLERGWGGHSKQRDMNKGSGYITGEPQSNITPLYSEKSVMKPYMQ